MKLHNAQDAIKQAEEVGFKSADFLEQGGGNYWMNYAAVFSSPLFWQALGKARGWNNKWPNEDSKDNAARWFDTHYHNGDENKFWESLP